MKKRTLLTSIIVLTIVMTSNAQNFGIYKDPRDGKTYTTAKIGSQIWMAENLAYKVEKGCWAYDDDESNVKIYGYLYNWEATKMVAPPGWHVATDQDWSELQFHLDGGVASGRLLKETGTNHWKSPNNTVNDDAGFTALPGGSRDLNGAYTSIGKFGKWWTSSEKDENRGLEILMFYITQTITKFPENKNIGLSIRCVKD